MKSFPFLPWLLALAATLLLPGCATQNGNPPQARANTGYADFHADPPGELSWAVSRFDERAQTFRSVFSELTPPPGGIVRLALAPGQHRFQVTFLNRVVVQPAEVAVEILDGKITPIRVTLTETGVAQVQTKDYSQGRNVRGNYGRRTKTGSDEAARYSLTTQPDPPVPYQPKERTAYAR